MKFSIQRLFLLGFLFLIHSAALSAVVPIVEVRSADRRPAITGPATELAKNPGENGSIYKNGSTKKQKALTPVFSWSRSKSKKPSKVEN